MVITTYLRPNSLGRCLDSILTGTYRDLEVVVVDDAADPATREVVEARSRPNLTYLSHPSRTLSAQALNDGIRACRGELIVVTDDDNVLDPAAIAGFVRAFERNPRTAFVGPLIYYLSPRDVIHTAGGFLTRFTRRMVNPGQNEVDRGQFTHPFDAEIVDGCFAVRRSALEVTGLIDAKRLPFYHETTSLQFRARRAGLPIEVDPTVRVWHDLPLAARQERAVVSPLRMYYMMRSRLFLERDYDEPSKTTTFALAIPFYLLSYLLQVLAANTTAAVKRNVLRALLSGLADGLLGRDGIKIL